jgi:hypothetical protein
MRWKKLGLLYKPEKKFWWDQIYAMMPTPVYLQDQKLIRVYFGITDQNRFGRTSYIDLHEDNILNIKYDPQNFILDIGKDGTFDDSGIIPSSIVNISNQQFLYYVGFQRTQKVPYMLFAGLAIAQDYTLFKRYSQAPVIDRNRENIFSNAAPFVMYDEDEQLFKMWFWLGKEWVIVNEKQYIKAEIHYSTSADGKTWSLNEVPCIVPDPKTEFSVGRPWIIKASGTYKMYYSIRYIDKLYRLGYAESNDGKSWIRKDKEIGIDVSEKGWDSEMICYPAVITVKDKTYLFYNGNNNGETGFGVAELLQ